jgi:putative DNA primase/helicase
MSGNVTPFPEAERERLRRLGAEVDRLSRLPTSEWRLYVSDPDHASRYGVDCAAFALMVKTVVDGNEKARREEAAEQRRVAEHNEKQRDREDRRARQAKADERRDAEHDRKEFERERKEAERAEAHRKKLDAVFAEIADLPKLTHETRLREAAKRLKEDFEVLVAEFAVYCAERTISEDLEPWPDPVNTAVLLDDIHAQLLRYVVIHDKAAADICALVTLFAWVHDEIAIYSPIFVIQAADIGSAKTTLTLAIAQLTPRPRVIAKPTGPSLYRMVDREHPTLCVDNADKLLARDRNLAEIVTVSWTRGITIPRMDRHGDIYDFDPFCCKILNGIDLLPHLDPAVRSRCIVIDLLPKLPDETVINFKHAAADERFATLCRQAERWANDHMAALKEAEPAIPAGFNDRTAENYTLPFAIADLAGKEWAKRARAAAEKVTRQYDAPSLGIQLLNTFFDLFVKHGDELTSKQVEKALPSISDTWANYKNSGRPINKWQTAKLLEPYRVGPTTIHPRGRKTSDRGYRARDFEVPFRHYLGKTLPEILPDPAQRKTKG